MLSEVVVFFPCRGEKPGLLAFFFVMSHCKLHIIACNSGKMHPGKLLQCYCHHPVAYEVRLSVYWNMQLFSRYSKPF